MLSSERLFTDAAGDTEMDAILTLRVVGSHPFVLSTLAMVPWAVVLDSAV